MKELEKTYSPEKIEGRIYRKWLEGKYFHAEVNKDKKPFTIIMPHLTTPCRIYLSDIREWQDTRHFGSREQTMRL